VVTGPTAAAIGLRNIDAASLIDQPRAGEGGRTLPHLRCKAGRPFTMYWKYGLTLVKPSP
jgi:hypothetical protein